MNILLGCNHLNELGGSEQHLYTLSKAFSKLNHNVYVILGNFTLKGIMSDKLRDELNINVDEIPKNISFDAVFLSHSSTVKRFKDEFYNRKDLSFNNNNIFQICHGKFHNIENPSLWDKLGFIAISDEIYDHVIDKTNGNSDVYKILNPIDTDLFHYTISNPIPKSIFSLSQSEEFNTILSEICSELKMTFTKNNKHTNPNPDIRKNIENSDIVVSLGRGCYEAMSMGKNVLIADFRSYMNDGLMDGLVTDDWFNYFVKNNCSGRFFNNKASKKNLIEEINNYNVDNCYPNRKHIVESLDYIKIAKDYLSIIKN